MTSFQSSTRHSSNQPLAKPDEGEWLPLTSSSEYDKGDPNSHEPQKFDPRERPTALTKLYKEFSNCYIWWFEILALLASGLALMATIILLKYVDDTAISSWSEEQSGLSINAILSILSTVSRSCLLVPLDEVMGQLMWLAFTQQERRLYDVELYNEASRGPWGAMKLIWRRKRRGIASFGCILTIFAVGLGPVQQQLISYPTRIRASASPEARLAIHPFSYETYGQASSSNSPKPMNPFRIWRFIFAAFDDDATSLPTRPYICPSSSCNFDRTSTLGVCYRCQNATEEIQTRCEHDTCWSDYRNLTISFTNSTLYAINQTVDTSNSTSIAKTFSLYSKIDSSVSTWPPIHNACVCELVWCKTTLQGKVRNFTYSETVFKTSILSQLSNDGTLTVGSGQPDNEHITVGRQAQEVYKHLSTNLTGWSVSEINHTTHSSEIFGAFSVLPTTGDMSEKPGLSSMYLSNISSIYPISRVAYGMSNAIRFQGTWSVGDQVVPTAMIHVRWWWLLYPVVIWVCCAVFLVRTLRKTTAGADGIGAWRCSSLALLLCGVDEQVRNQAGHCSLDQMKVRAKSVNVRLARDGPGWRMKMGKINRRNSHI